LSTAKGSIAVSTTLQDPRELLHDTLEAQFEQHTDRLLHLVVQARQVGGQRKWAQTLAPRMDSARRAVADTAHALERMANGTYGVCVGCQTTIPLHRLHAAPQTRHCGPCQRTATD
jgi:RNA polymerase-binding transcription factor DksA